MPKVTTISPDVLAEPIVAPMSCRNLAASTLQEVVGAEPTLLVFLRHFG